MIARSNRGTRLAKSIRARQKRKRIKQVITLVTDNRYARLRRRRKNLQKSSNTT